MTKTILTIQEKQNSAFAQMKEAFGYKNPMEAPRLIKVVVSSGTGRITRTDKKRNDVVADRLSKITGQKPLPAPAKQSVAAFKTRQGEIIGFSVTLRGARMRAFLEKLLNVALPRAKDFRGIPPRAVDEMGNCTIGIKEHTIFPESSDEDLRDVFGFAVSIVTTAKNSDEARVFLKLLGVPFRETDEPKAEKKKRKKA